MHERIRPVSVMANVLKSFHITPAFLRYCSIIHYGNMRQKRKSAMLNV
jgi:hypothetical protein